MQIMKQLQKYNNFINLYFSQCVICMFGSGVVNVNVLFVTNQQTATQRASSERKYDIASSDARLARILQEQERLDGLRRAEERRIRRLEREQLVCSRVDCAF